MIVFVLFTVLMCSDLIFNLLKRVTDGSFLFLCKTLLFLFPRSFFFWFSLMALFHGWGSTVSRLQSHDEETVYFFEFGRKSGVPKIGIPTSNQL